MEAAVVRVVVSRLVVEEEEGQVGGLVVVVRETGTGTWIQLCLSTAVRVRVK